MLQVKREILPVVGVEIIQPKVILKNKKQQGESPCLFCDNKLIMSIKQSLFIY